MSVAGENSEPVVSTVDRNRGASGRLPRTLLIMEWFIVEYLLVFCYALMSPKALSIV